MCSACAVCPVQSVCACGGERLLASGHVVRHRRDVVPRYLAGARPPPLAPAVVEQVEAILLLLHHRLRPRPVQHEDRAAHRHRDRRAGRLAQQRQPHARRLHRPTAALAAATAAGCRPRLAVVARGTQPEQRVLLALDRGGEAIVRHRCTVALHDLVAHLDTEAVGAASRLHADHAVLVVQVEAEAAVLAHHRHRAAPLVGRPAQRERRARVAARRRRRPHDAGTDPARRGGIGAERLRQGRDEGVRQ